MKRTQREPNERSTLDKRSELRPVDPDGYPLPTSRADVLVSLEGGSTVNQANKRDFWFKWIGFAPANSPFGHALATMPLCLTLSLPPFTMAAASYLFIRIAWVTGLALLLGFAGGAGLCVYQLKREAPRVTTQVFAGEALHPAPPSEPE
jgi:hypothetical protein